MYVKEAANGDFTIGLQVAQSQQKRRAIALHTFFKKAQKTDSKEAAYKAQILADAALLCDYLPAMVSVIDGPRSGALQVDLDTFSPILLRVMPALNFSVEQTG